MKKVIQKEKEENTSKEYIMIKNSNINIKKC